MRMLHLLDLATLFTEYVDGFFVLDQKVHLLRLENALHRDRDVGHKLAQVFRLEHLADGLRVLDEFVDLEGLHDLTLARVAAQSADRGAFPRPAPAKLVRRVNEERRGLSDRVSFVGGRRWSHQRCVAFLDERELVSEGHCEVVTCAFSGFSLFRDDLVRDGLGCYLHRFGADVVPHELLFCVFRERRVDLLWRGDFDHADFFNLFI